MTSVHRVFLLSFLSTLILLSFGVTSAHNPPADNSHGGLSIGHYTLIKKERIRGTKRFLYTLRAEITNTGPRVLGATATVKSLSQDVVVVDGELTFGKVYSKKRVRSRDTFSIRADERHYKEIYCKKIPSNSKKNQDADKNRDNDRRRDDDPSCVLVWTIQVKGEPSANQPPAWSPFENPTLNEGSVLDLPVTATDPEGDSLVLTLSPLPAFARFTDHGNGTGTLSLSPDFTQSGNYNLTLTATDSRGASANRTFSVVVQDVNRPPHITSPQVTDAGEARAYTFQIVAEDPDQDPLTYRLTLAPGGMGIDPVSGLLSWTPTALQVGIHNFTVQIQDGRGGTDTRSYSLTVVATVDRVAPMVTLSAPSQVMVSEPVIISAQATDNVGVTKVSFYVDGLLVRETATEPYSMSYNAPDQEGTVVHVRTVALDAAGNQGEAAASVQVVATPDTTPPVIEAIRLPSAAAPGDQVLMQAVVKDDRGVAEVRFLYQGNVLTTDTGPPYESILTIPIDSPPDATIQVDIEAVDTSGNRTPGQATLVVQETSDITPPAFVTLQGPAEALAGQQIVLSSSAVDDVGIFKVLFFADGVQIAEDPDPPYGTSYTISDSKEAGSQVVFMAEAIDFFNNRTASQPVAARIATPGEGFLSGEVYDDSTGLPLAGATLRVSLVRGRAPDSRIETVSDHRGRYKLLLPEGEAAVEIHAAGFTGAARMIQVEAGKVNVPLDVRLTPLAPSIGVSSAAGAVLGLEDGRVQLTLVPGVFAADTAVTLTPLSGQALPAPLPPGWTPLLAVHIGPEDSTPQQGLELVLKNVTSDAPVPVQWDSGTRQWRHLASTRLTSEQALIVAVPDMGTVAFARADVQPAAPTTPGIGEALVGVSLDPIPAGALSSIFPNPTILFMQPGAKSQVAARLSSDVRLPSGTRIEVDFSETYDRTDGTRLSPEPMTQDFLLYQQDTGFESYFVASPSEIFAPVLLREGVIRLVAHRPEGADGVGVIGPAGGTVASLEGIALAIPPGALASPVPVSINSVPAVIPGIDGDPRFEVLAEVSVDFGGLELATAARLSVSSPVPLSADDQVVVVQPIRIGDETLPELIGIVTISGDTLSVDAGTAGLPLPGVRAEGRYYFLRMTQSVAFITGSVESGGVAVIDGLVTIDTIPFVSRTNTVEPAYVVASTLGVATVAGLDLTDGSSGSADAVFSVRDEIVIRDLQLVQVRPRVVEINPADGATNAIATGNVRVQFSRPMNPASLDGSGFQLLLGGAPVTGSVNPSPDGLTATLEPTVPLQSDTLYTVSLSASLSDTFGNRFLGNQPDGSFISSFRTQDTTPPARPAAGQVTAEYPERDVLLVSGTQGSAEPGGAITVSNAATGASVTVLANADGSFELRIPATPEAAVTLDYADGAGNSTSVTFERPVVLTGLQVSPTRLLILALGEQRGLNVSASFSDGTQVSPALTDVAVEVSNPLVVSVDAVNGTVTSLGDGDAVVSLSFGQEPYRQTVSLPIRVMSTGQVLVEQIVGAAGGDIELDNGLALRIPEGALTGDVPLKVEQFPLEGPLVIDLDGVPVQVLSVYRFSPDIDFAKPIMLEIPIEASALASLPESDGAAVLSTRSASLNDLNMDDVPDVEDEQIHQYFDRLNSKVRVLTNHFSYRVIMRIPDTAIVGSVSQTLTQNGGASVSIRSYPGIYPVSTKTQHDRFVVLHATNPGVNLNFRLSFGADFLGRTLTFSVTAAGTQFMTPSVTAGLGTSITRTVGISRVIDFTITAKQPDFDLTIQRNVGTVLQSYVRPIHVDDFLATISASIPLTTGTTNQVITAGMTIGTYRTDLPANTPEVDNQPSQNVEIMNSRNIAVAAHFYVNSRGLIYQLYKPEVNIGHAHLSNGHSTGIEIQHTIGLKELYAGPQIDAVIALTDYLLNRPNQDTLVGDRGRRRRPNVLATSYPTLTRIGADHPDTRANPLIGDVEPAITHREQSRDYETDSNDPPFACGTLFHKADPCGDSFDIEAVAAALAYDFPGLINTSGGDLLQSKLNIRPAKGGNATIKYGMDPENRTGVDPPEMELALFKGIPGGQQTTPVDLVKVAAGETITLSSRDDIANLIIRGTVELTDDVVLRVSGMTYLAPGGKIVSKKTGNGASLTIRAAGPVILHGLVDLSGESTNDTAPGNGGNLTVLSRALSPLLVPTIITQGGDVMSFDETLDPLLGVGGQGGDVTIQGPPKGLIVFSGLKQDPIELLLGGVPCSYPSGVSGEAGLLFPVDFFPNDIVAVPDAWRYSSAIESPFCLRLPVLGEELSDTLGRGIVTSGGMGGAVKSSQKGILQGAPGGNGGNIRISFPTGDAGVIRFRGVSLNSGGGGGFMHSQIPVVFLKRADPQFSPFIQRKGSAGGKGSVGNLRSQTSQVEGDVLFTSYFAPVGGEGGEGGHAGDIFIDRAAQVFPPPDRACTKSKGVVGHDGNIPKEKPTQVIGKTVTFCGPVEGGNLDLLSINLEVDDQGDPCPGDLQCLNPKVLGGSGGLAGGSVFNNPLPPPVNSPFDTDGTAGHFGRRGTGGNLLNLPPSLREAIPH